MGRLERLTKRQREILELVCTHNVTTEEAATSLGISRETLRNHLAVAYERLQVHGIGPACYLLGIEHGRTNVRPRGVGMRANEV